MDCLNLCLKKKPVPRYLQCTKRQPAIIVSIFVKCACTELTIAELKNLNFPGELAFKCLQSFPFHQEESVQMVDELKKYLQFQSTLETLKSKSSWYISTILI